MAVHVFVVDEENYKICIQRGLVAVSDHTNAATRDILISRMTMIKDDDYILLYIKSLKELHGVWQADGGAFYDTSHVWKDRVYPFRCKIKCSEHVFEKPLNLYDIIDLNNGGKIWTWALRRPGGSSSNSIFSISDREFNILWDELIKINPFTMKKSVILAPYPYHESDLLDYIARDEESTEPCFESSIMACINHAFANGKYTDVFGNYTDYLSYVPTNMGSEIDGLLFFGNPKKPENVMSYDIIEVKRDRFTKKHLAQLISYETWFLQKKVSGDNNMVRATAIAKRFDDDVVDYVRKRSEIERKLIKLLRFSFDEHGKLVFKELN